MRCAIRARPDLDSRNTRPPPLCFGHAPPPCLVFPRPRRLSPALPIPVTFPRRERKKKSHNRPLFIFLALSFPSKVVFRESHTTI